MIICELINSEKTLHSTIAKNNNRTFCEFSFILLHASLIKSSHFGFAWTSKLITVSASWAIKTNKIEMSRVMKNWNCISIWTDHIIRQCLTNVTWNWKERYDFFVIVVDKPNIVSSQYLNREHELLRNEVKNT